MTDPEGFCSCSLWEEQGAEGKRREDKETEKRHFQNLPGHRALASCLPRSVWD